MSATSLGSAGGAAKSQAEGATSLPRRNPAQKRSRERLDLILAAATDLIARSGSDQLKMTEVAERAGISIGSLYQYFPEKRSIIRSLAERYRIESRRCIEDALAGVSNIRELEDAYLGLVDQYYALFLEEPVMRDIWSGMQADKYLLDLELAESRVSGAMLANAMRRARRECDPARFEAIAFLIWQLGDATMRLAISVDREEGDIIVEAFKHMSLREILNA